MTDQAKPVASRLAMQGIGKRFGATVALEGVDLVVAAGEIHALVGENGAGKSTLMKVLSGAERADAGTIRLDGVPVDAASPHDARRAGVAMIYQELSLADHLTVEENIWLGVEPATAGFVRREQARRGARAALDQMGHRDIRLDTRACDLSVAERQVVEIARAIASGCRVLVLDEPTSSLSRDDVQQLFRVLRNLRDGGHAIVYISHFLEEVTEIADRFSVLRDGRVAGSGRTADRTVTDLVDLMVGRRIEQLYPRSRRSAGDIILSADGLAGETSPRSADLFLRRGEVLGIAGLVGSGRTELLRLLFSLDRVKRGKLHIGVFSGPATPADRLAQGVGLLSEDRKEEGLALGMCVADNLTLSRLAGMGPFGLVLPRLQDRVARQWIERLSIRCRSPRQRMTGLSGGNQQKVALARLLHHDVDIFLLDEPTRGIDVASKAEVYKVIDTLASGDPEERRPPRAVLMVSSYFPELLGVCDRIAVMHRGILNPARPVGEWDEHSLLLAATGEAA